MEGRRVPRGHPQGQRPLVDYLQDVESSLCAGGGTQMAQAGGKDPSKLSDALRVAHEFATRAAAQIA